MGKNLQSVENITQEQKSHWSLSRSLLCGADDKIK